MSCSRYSESIIESSDTVCLTEEKYFLDLRKLSEKIKYVSSIFNSHKLVIVSDFIRSLNLSNNVITSLKDINIGNNRSLISLNLMNNAMTNFIIDKTLEKSLIKCQYINISYNKITNLVVNLKNLTKLNVKGNCINDNIKINCPNLVELCLNSNNLTEKFVEELRKPEFKKLKILDISSNNISGNIDISFLSELIELNITNNKITNINLPPKLQKLYSSSNLFTELDISYLNLCHLFCNCKTLKKIKCKKDFNMISNTIKLDSHVEIIKIKN
mgnify:CR=1 FL=1